MTFRTVLIVDHDHESRISLRRIFEEAGHFVVSSTTGAEAILMLEKVSVPSIVLVATDVMMMSGEHFLSGFLRYEIYSKLPAVQIKRLNSEPDLPGVCATFLPPYKKEVILEILNECED